MHEVSGWIFEDNLTRVVEYIAVLVRYEWSDLDDGALESGIASTDADLPPGSWFEYPVVGTPDVVLRIARDHGGGILSVTISGELDTMLAGEPQSQNTFSIEPQASGSSTGSIVGPLARRTP